MFFNALLCLSTLLTFAAAIPQQPQDIPEPFTVTRVVHAITDVAPFIVEQTTVFTFTYVPFRSRHTPTNDARSAQAHRPVSPSPQEQASSASFSLLLWITARSLHSPAE
ncbi:hypothetical protein C8R44DRAFT_858243 [Mycena epipterygia]|nr:hypothetical protein C8R44DRAFT_858243 [Mycena epipterygia]